MNARSLIVLAGVGALLLCASVIAFAGCGGNGGGEREATSTSEAIPTVSAEQLREIEAIPDLSCEDCPAAADVASDEKLSGSEAMGAIEASGEASDIYALAGELGYHDVLQGLKTSYTDGTVVHSAVIRGNEKGAAILATSTGPTAASVLIRLDPDNPDRLIVTDRQGSATVTWAGELIDSQDAHSSCRYWHCVGAAISWLYSHSWYGHLLGGWCHQCADELDEYWCTLCITGSPSGLLAGVGDCGIDKCDHCKDDSCGEDEVKSRQCQLDPTSIGIGRTLIYGIFDTVDDYYCQNPGEATSQCMVNYGALRLVQVCPGDCAADGVSCAPAQPRTCDAQACSAQTEVYSTGPCLYRYLKKQGRVDLEVTGRIWSCQPDGAGGSVCVPGPVSTWEQYCPYGCTADEKACRSPSPMPTATPTITPTPLPTLTPTPTRTPLPSCDPATCNREEAEGEPRCAYSYAEGYIVEQTYRQYSCKAQTLGGSTCESTTEARTVAHCPYGCAADGKSCVQPTPGTVPAAPTNFLALQHPGGTQFQWQDNSNNEDGFHIYFGGRSVGRPSTLIATAGPNTTSIDTDFVRSGGEECWEIYAFNAAGESAPGIYCLPP
jgi:hypothetical protein